MQYFLTKSFFLTNSAKKKNLNPNRFNLVGCENMGTDFLEITINIIKMAVIFLLMVQMVPLLVWVERRGSAFIQNRFGPNRIGPLGLMQNLADLVKFLCKEDFLGHKGQKAFFYSAPVLSLIPAVLAFGAIPLSAPVQVEAFEWLGRTFGPYTFYFQSFVMNIGIVFVLGVSSLAVYALLLAGWSSGSKFSLYGALRASAQAISYELALSLSVVGVIFAFWQFSFFRNHQCAKWPFKLCLLWPTSHSGFSPKLGDFLSAFRGDFALLRPICRSQPPTF